MLGTTLTPTGSGRGQRLSCVLRLTWLCVLSGSGKCRAVRGEVPARRLPPTGTGCLVFPRGGGLQAEGLHLLLQHVPVPWEL